MCVLMHIYTSWHIPSEPRHLGTAGFFLPGSSLQESACRNVTCQPSRVDTCFHSASFQSPLHSEATDCAGCTEVGAAAVL